MQYDSLSVIFRNLNNAGVKYLVVGGLAVVAHGYVRFTADVDLLVDFDPANAANAVNVFMAIGYTPRAPVPIEDFSNPEKRLAWVKEKGMKVFSLFSAAHPATEIDLFVDEPLDFHQAFANVVMFDLADGIGVPVCSLADLIKLKRIAGRPRDLLDIQKLTEINQDKT